MRKNKLMQFVVTQEQFDRIRNLTKAKGFIHMADYIRYAVLDKDLAFERKFEELYTTMNLLVEEMTENRKKGQNNI